MPHRIATALVAVSLLCAGCARDGGTAGFHVVAAFAPLGEIVEAVAQETVAVEVLTAPGAEAHDLEPDADQVAALQGADLVVYLGGGFQPAVVAAVRSRPARARLDLLRRSPSVDGELHLWLDLEQMRAWTREVRERLASLLPEHRTLFAENADAFTSELLALDRGFREGLRDCATRTFVATHDAFGELATRYGLTQAALAGAEPEAEPDPRTLAEIVRVVRREGLRTVFTEPGAPSRVTATLARETGTEVAVLDPIEIVSDEPSATYLTRMRENLAALRRGLRCR